MDDPITMLIKGVTRIMVYVGFAIGDALNALFRAILRRGNQTRTPRSVRQAQQQLANTHEREEQYRQIVTQFNRTLGYIASEAISRPELEALIDQGIDPQELISEIYRRIRKVPGIVLGKNQYLDNMEMKLPYSLRDRHAYLIGRSGSGKTNLIRTMLLQDIYYGQGVGVLAPEQELITEEILPYIPEDRIEDVIYINPADSKFPIAFNPLHCEPWEDKRTKIEDFVTIFKRAVGDTGFRMDDILDHALEALIDRKGSTLLDIPRFLSRVNPQFRSEVLKTSSERVRMFFEEIYPTMERNAANPVISRINAFTARDAVRNLLCQPNASFNFRHAMDEAKIILINLSDGILGESGSQLLGQIIISKFQLAAMSRADTPKALRHPFHLYLDEFATFVGVAQTSYSAILSRARKYKVGVVMAHQNTAQIPEKLLKEIFGNVHAFIAFNVSSEDARKLSDEYALDLGADVDFVPYGEFIRLKTGSAIGKIGRNVFPLETILLPSDPNPEKLEYIINRSQRNYGNGAKWEVNIKPFDERWKYPQLPPPKDDPGKVY